MPAVFLRACDKGKNISLFTEKEDYHKLKRNIKVSLESGCIFVNPFVLHHGLTKQSVMFMEDKEKPSIAVRVMDGLIKLFSLVEILEKLKDWFS